MAVAVVCDSVCTDSELNCWSRKKGGGYVLRGESRLRCKYQVQGLGAGKVVDYVANKPMDEQIAEVSLKTEFDAIIDVIGIQELYIGRPAQIRTSKPYLQMKRSSALSPTLTCESR